MIVMSNKDVPYAGKWLADFLANRPAPRMKRFPNALEEDEAYVPVEIEACECNTDSPEFEFETLF